MARIVYVNGRYLPYAQAGVHVEDRGFQFADSVYEVCEVQGGMLVDATRHLQRLARSLSELKIAAPMGERALRHVLMETIRRNRVRDGLVYVQVSRGQGPRDFPFPGEATEPTLVVVARPLDQAKIKARADKGIAVRSVPDMRWGRCDLKTVMLLPAGLAKEAARAEGAHDAWLVDDKGFVTEGASSNAWIVDKEGRLVTRKANQEILRGITRTTLLDLLKREGLEVVERPFTVAEAKAAREAFITSATNLVMPVVAIDGATVGNGSPGLLTLRLRRQFHEVAELASS